MEILNQLIEVVLNLDKNLNLLISNYGFWTYLILFLIIFCETGLVVMPFLPGDSLLFAVGNIAARGTLDFWSLILLLSIAAILGDTLNYTIGHFVGPKVFSEKSRFLKQSHLDRTKRFFEKYGGKTIIFARFVPIVRTFAPFIAGVGTMAYGRFAMFNVVGGIAWIALFLAGGYFFGSMSVVQKNFTFVIAGIIIVSIIPGLIEYIRHKRAARQVID